MINRVVLTGRLTKDVVLNKTQNGKSLTSFNLAVDRQFVDKQTGQREADFIRCVAWGKTAELISQYTNRGSLIGIDGRIQTRNYKDKNGNTVFVTEVFVDSVTFLSSNQNNQNNYQPQSKTSQQPAQDPFSGSNEVEISDDDLPF